MSKLNALIISAFLTFTAHAQGVKAILFFGGGVTSLLSNGTKNIPIVAGGKLNFTVSKNWFVQPFFGVSDIHLASLSQKPWWTVQAGMLGGRKFHYLHNRLSVLGGVSANRNKVGDFLPTAMVGPVIKINKHWAILSLASRNSQSWGASTTLGYVF